MTRTRSLSDPVQVDGRWVFADGRTLPVVSGGADDGSDIDDGGGDGEGTGDGAGSGGDRGRPGGASKVSQLSEQMAAMQAKLDELAEAKAGEVTKKATARDEANRLEAEFNTLKAKLEHAELVTKSAASGARNPETLARLLAGAADVDAKIDALRETDSYLFKPKASGPDGHDPNGGDRQTDGGKLKSFDRAMAEQFGG